LDAYSSDDNHSAQQLTTDYLEALKGHLISILRNQLSGFQIKSIPLEFILTVPAVWSESAKEKTLVAAENAGLGNDAPIHMISEPVSLF
jgi:molecular chaperone DnaK (HSP70)